MKRGEQCAELDNSKKDLTTVDLLTSMISDEDDQTEFLENL